MDRLAIIVPVLGRPENVEPLLRSIDEVTPEPYRTIFVADPHDSEEHAAVEASGGELLIVRGNYAKKVNEAAKITDEELLFLGADDLKFHHGWLEAAKRKMRGRIGVVGTNDLGNPRVIAGHHSTHSLVARWYANIGTIDEQDKILHEGYPHEYVDDEFVETAKSRSAFVSCKASIVEHLHPLWEKNEWDGLYLGMKPRMREGQRIYRTRRHLWRRQRALRPSGRTNG